MASRNLNQWESIIEKATQFYYVRVCGSCHELRLTLHYIRTVMMSHYKQIRDTVPLDWWVEVASLRGNLWCTLGTNQTVQACWGEDPASLSSVALQQTAALHDNAS